MSEACKSRTWYTCPAGSGTSSKSTGYPDCCPGKSDYYCPNGAQECISGGGCCQTGFDVHCSTGQKSWCCSSAYPICGYDGGCYGGSCSCGVCSGSVDSCQFQSCGDSCSACCSMYSYICQGPATCKSPKGFLGVKTTRADRQCYPIEDVQKPVPGRYYLIKSKFGHYLDMIQGLGSWDDNVRGGTKMRARAVTEAHMNRNSLDQDSFLIELIDKGKGYFLLKSKFGRYFDMTNPSTFSETSNVWSVSDLYMEKNGEGNFVVKLIDKGDGYYHIQSKFGRYLDLRQEESKSFIGQSTESWEAWSMTEEYMNKNLWAKDSRLIKFIMVEQVRYKVSKTPTLGGNEVKYSFIDLSRGGPLQLKKIRMTFEFNSLKAIQVTTTDQSNEYTNTDYGQFGSFYGEQYTFNSTSKISSVSICYNTKSVTGIRFNYVGGKSSQNYGNFDSCVSGTIRIDGEIIGVHGNLRDWFHGTVINLGFIVSKKI